MRWSNCYVFAAQQWLDGWRVRFVRSRYGWWPHAQASPDGLSWYDFVPDHPKRRWVPPLIFRGHIRMRVERTED